MNDICSSSLRAGTKGFTCGKWIIDYNFGIDDGGELKFSTHKEYCNADRTTWKLTLQDINTPPKELKTEGDCSRRQLFRPFWGSSAHGVTTKEAVMKNIRALWFKP